MIICACRHSKPRQSRIIAGDAASSSIRSSGRAFRFYLYRKLIMCWGVMTAKALDDYSSPTHLLANTELAER